MLKEFGHTISFWTLQPKASTRLLNAFYDSGRSTTRSTSQSDVDFTPEVTQTALGKGFAGDDGRPRA